MNAVNIFVYFSIFTIAFLGIALYVFRKMFFIIQVDGCSMAPYLMSGDRVLVIRYFTPKLIKRGAVVLFESWSKPLSDHNSFSIKRVAGLPNDTLAICETELGALKCFISIDTYNYYSSIYAPSTSVTYIMRMPDSNVKQIPQELLKNYKTEKVPPGHLFVKGDWLFGGDDSIIRGPILRQKVIGVMLAKLSP